MTRTTLTVRVIRCVTNNGSDTTVVYNRISAIDVSGRCAMANAYVIAGGGSDIGLDTPKVLVTKLQDKTNKLLDKTHKIRFIDAAKESVETTATDFHN